METVGCLPWYWRSREKSLYLWNYWVFLKHSDYSLFWLFTILTRFSELREGHSDIFFLRFSLVSFLSSLPSHPPLDSLLSYLPKDWSDSTLEEGMVVKSFIFILQKGGPSVYWWSASPKWFCWAIASSFLHFLSNIWHFAFHCRLLFLISLFCTSINKHIRHVTCSTLWLPRDSSFMYRGHPSSLWTSIHNHRMPLFILYIISPCVSVGNGSVRLVTYSASPRSKGQSDLSWSSHVLWGFYHSTYIFNWDFNRSIVLIWRSYLCF